MAVGGQALINGVMMRTKNFITYSVRKDSEIIYKQERIKQRKMSDIWFIRGVYNLILMLIMGMRGLLWSSSIDSEEEFTGMQTLWFGLSSFLLAILIFMGIPFGLTRLLGLQGTAFNITEGVMRLGIFVLYVIVISRMKDVKEIFQYHGAEHKSVHCYESGEEVCLKNAKKYTTKHPRCGTSFIFIVMFVSIVVFSFITFPSYLIKMLLRLILIPVIASISYEILMFSNKFNLTILNWPGLWIQNFTTFEPTDNQLEVAIHALNKTLELENAIN